jgi:hypothetical protein
VREYVRLLGFKRGVVVSGLLVSGDSGVSDGALLLGLEGHSGPRELGYHYI